jgi:hypothetical protein
LEIADCELVYRRLQIGLEIADRGQFVDWPIGNSIRNRQFNPQSATQSTIHNPIRNPQSPLDKPQSAVGSRQSAIDTV